MRWFCQYSRWILSAWIIFVFVQSLFFKFSNSYETQHIFGTLGEWAGLPWFSAYGGYAVGVAELIAALLLLTPFWVWGAVLAFEIMAGAIVFHLFTPLGIVMPSFDAATGAVMGDDGGTLFVMACITGLCAVLLVVKDWTSSNSVLRRFIPGKKV